MSNYPNYNGNGNNYNNYNYPQSQTQYGSLDTRVSAVMKSVYLKMTLGLVVSALVALFTASSTGMLQFLYGNSVTIWVLFGVELLLVLAISAGITKLSSTTATALFYLFAAVNGLTLSSIFIVYKLPSIVMTFFITAGTFGAMSIYGYFTNRDLSKMGSILIMALFGLIIASVVNIFMKSSQLDWIISFAGVLIFVGLTAWDTQKIKQMAMTAPGEMTSRLATIGALSLYLDFINLFLYLLRFFGNSRN